MKNDKKNNSKIEGEPLTYQAYRAYLSSKLRHLKVDQVYKDAFTINNNLKI
jgi:hypothetical protein